MRWPLTKSHWPRLDDVEARNEFPEEMATPEAKEAFWKEFRESARCELR